jgi:hypothetical protein
MSGETYAGKLASDIVAWTQQLREDEWAPHPLWERYWNLVMAEMDCGIDEVLTRTELGERWRIEALVGLASPPPLPSPELRPLPVLRIQPWEQP